MNRLVTIAFDMQARIEEIAELQDKVVVDRQTNLKDAFLTRINKPTGLCVVIALQSATNPRPKFRTARFTGRYTVNLFLSRLLNADDASRSDDLMAAIIDKLHGWIPTSMPQNHTISLRATDIDFPETEHYAVTQLTAEIL